MIITLAPQRRDQAIEYEINGDVITVTSGETVDVLDFSGPGDGVWEPDRQSGLIDDMGFVTTARREAGVVHVTLVAPHGDAPSAAERYPEPVTTAAATLTFPVAQEQV